jgi:hypothetical protein
MSINPMVLRECLLDRIERLSTYVKETLDDIMMRFDDYAEYDEIGLTFMVQSIDTDGNIEDMLAGLDFDPKLVSYEDSAGFLSAVMTKEFFYRSIYKHQNVWYCGIVYDGADDKQHNIRMPLALLTVMYLGNSKSGTASGFDIQIPPMFIDPVTDQPIELETLQFMVKAQAPGKYLH